MMHRYLHHLTGRDPSFPDTLDSDSDRTVSGRSLLFGPAQDGRAVYWKDSGIYYALAGQQPGRSSVSLDDALASLAEEIFRQP
jgi:hypothetical protein